MTGSKLLNMIEQLAINKMNKGLELATIVQVTPSLVIRVDNMGVDLDMDFLVVSQHLLKDQWIVTLNHYEGAQRNYAGEVFVDLLDTDNNASPYSSYTHDNILLTYKETIRPGDRVAVMPLEGGNKYYVIDKVEGQV